MADSAFTLTEGSGEITGTDTISTLKGKVPVDGQVAFLVAKNAVGDNLGGIYRFDINATGADDMQFMNIISSSMTTVGRWVRVFQKAKVYPQGILVNAGGVKTMYAPGTTNSSGQFVLQITEDNTPTGANIYNEIWQIAVQQSPTTVTGSAPIVGYGIVSSDMKSITCYCSQSNTTTLGSTLLNIAGMVITGLKPVPAGVPIQVIVTGI